MGIHLTFQFKIHPRLKSERDWVKKCNLDYEGVKTIVTVYKQVTVRKGCKGHPVNNALQFAKKWDFNLKK